MSEGITEEVRAVESYARGSYVRVAVRPGSFIRYHSNDTIAVQLVHILAHP